MWRFLYLCTERNDGQIQRSRQLLAIHIFQNALRSFLECVLHLLRSEMLFLYFQRYIASSSFLFVIDISVDVVVGATSAFAYFPSKQASASLRIFSSRCARQRLRPIVFEKGSKAEGRCVSVKRERVRVRQAIRQGVVCGCWCMWNVLVSRMHSVDGRRGWICDCFFIFLAMWVQA